jgi:hypothetical protein
MRGADSLFVHRVIAEYSCEAVRYAPAAEIRHLEITSVRDWLRKRILYGKSFEHNYHRRKATYRVMTRAESYAILSETVRRKGYNSLLQIACMIALLWTGRLCYLFGRFLARGEPYQV